MYKSKFVKADMRTTFGNEAHAISASSFEGIAELKDVYITAGQAFNLQISAHTESCYVLPIAGDVRVESAAINMSLMPGNIYQFPVELFRDAAFKNGFDEETINLLFIETRMPAAGNSIQAFNVPLDHKNALASPQGSDLSFKLGVYDSRSKGLIQVDDTNDLSVCYVINGSFEIAERLLEYKDALLLWDHTEIEFEALSEAAILLYIDFQKKQRIYSSEKHQ